MGACKQWDEVEKLLIGKNLWLETSLAALCDLDKATCARMLNGHDPDKILFGSDFPWYSMKLEYEYVESLGLPEELKKKLYSENALKLLGDKK